MCVLLHLTTLCKGCLIKLQSSIVTSLVQWYALFCLLGVRRLLVSLVPLVGAENVFDIPVYNNRRMLLDQVKRSPSPTFYAPQWSSSSKQDQKMMDPDLLWSHFPAITI